MRRIIAARDAVGVVTAALLACCAAPIAAAQGANSRDAALDSLLNTKISSASKYLQTSAQAPGAVTIVTSDEIRQYGYRTVLEVVESTPGFYASNDRNYPSLGARGFGRTGDYNNRILFLVDGHTLNDQTWGMAPMGTDFPIDLDAVERIEIVRGPGSAIYGSNAVFAVINVVTKTGAQLDGATISARAGSGRTRQAAFAGGHDLARKGAVAVSGLITHVGGGDLYFPEYDSPATNRGVAHDVDWERSASGLGSAAWGGLDARVGYRSRQKGIPTGAFATAFNDPRAETVDETFWGEIGGRRDLGPSAQVSIRLYGDRYRYRGVYPDTSASPYTDGGGSRDLGAEALLVWDPTSRHRLTLGTELRKVSRANYYESLGDGTTVSDNAPFTVASVYAQDEASLGPALTLTGGLRVDERSGDDERSGGDEGVSPRIALIATPDRQTTVKAIYGRAFRAPSAAEAHLQTSYYSRNPSLRAEHITTVELEVQRRVAEPILVGASLYHYRIRGLIDEVVDTLDQSAQYQNINSAIATGLELSTQVIPRGLLFGQASLALQRAYAGNGAGALTNSPDRVAVVSLGANTPAGLRPAVIARYESERRTLAGPSTPAFVRTDMNVAYTPARWSSAWFGRGEASLRVSNLFNVHYATPAGAEHREVMIAQDGRSGLLRLDWRF